MRQVVGLDALDQDLGRAGARQYQRGPDLLLGVLVAQYFAHAEGGGLFARGIATAGATALVGVDDAVVDAARGLVAQGGEQAADLRLDRFEVRRQLFAGGGEVGDGEWGVEAFEVIDGRCIQRGDIVARQIECPESGQVEQAARVGGNAQQQREGQRDLQQEAPLQYFDLCKLSWFIQIKKPLIRAK